MRADELREKYLTFFERKGCVRRPSDVLVPRWDPSVLFTPAGMNQFKDHFLGKCKLEFTRATSCQKCLRTGDIDNVGRTAYHHTFFEMLGNFSFGDYFKREAIHWAWEFLTDHKWLGLDRERISATVYQDDDEAAEIWLREVKLPHERVSRMGEDENFWPAGAPSHGPDGVCGPCSEIYYHSDTAGTVEIWNLVFTQFNRVGDPPGNLRPLPSKNIDTGMGLERTAAVLQGVDSNFHIDILRPLVEASGEICRVKYDPASDHGRRLRRIADHVRACTFAIHENVYPGPNKEKYVIKRLLRRAVLDGHQVGRREPFLYRLVPTVAQLMKSPYPELSETVDRVAQVIRNEEANFFATIDAGLDRIERLFHDMSRDGRVMVAGRDAADMFTTHGFPPELLEAMAAERNLIFDWEGFQREMQQHGIDSGAGQQRTLFRTSPLDPLKQAMRGNEFLGYESTETAGKIVGIIAQNELCEQLEEVGHEQPVVVVLDRSPFYGEAGGQVGDTGQIVGEGFQFDVADTQRDGTFILHLGHLREGSMRLGAAVTARVDTLRRQAIRRAHSATHLLHFVLQRHLGAHAQQQGSKVDADLLRFDFSHPTAVDRDELSAIEAEVNEKVMAAAPIHYQYMPLSEARQTGAMMLFGEKYPDVVRVVSIGEFSKELCGGTHLTNTGQIGLFTITEQQSVSAGTRRIVAVVGRAARERVTRNERLLRQAAAALSVPPAQIAERGSFLVKEINDLKKQAATTKAVALSADELASQATDVGGTKVVVAEVPGATAGSLRELIDQLRRKLQPVAVLLATRSEGEDAKVLLVAGISRDLLERGVSAAVWIASAAKIVGGSGGGRADMAQAGGKLTSKLPEALAAARTTVREILLAAEPGGTST